MTIVLYILSAMAVLAALLALFLFGLDRYASWKNSRCKHESTRIEDYTPHPKYNYHKVEICNKCGKKLHIIKD